MIVHTVTHLTAASPVNNSANANKGYGIFSVLSFDVAGAVCITGANNPTAHKTTPLI